MSQLRNPVSVNITHPISKPNLVFTDSGEDRTVLEMDPNGDVFLCGKVKVPKDMPDTKVQRLILRSKKEMIKKLEQANLDFLANGTIDLSIIPILLILATKQLKQEEK